MWDSFSQNFVRMASGVQITPLLRTWDSERNPESQSWNGAVLSSSEARAGRTEASMDARGICIWAVGP